MALAIGLALAGCSDAPEPAAEVVVTGEPGAQPTLAYDIPLTVTEPRVEVLAEGTGPELVEGAPVLVDYYAESAADRSVVGETFSGEPKPYLLTEEALGVDIYDALRGQRVGARILQLVPATDAQAGPTVAVFDVLATRASGEQVEPRAGMPTVTLADDGAPTITLPAAGPPTEAVVQPLIRGTGPQVEPGQIITVQYTGVTWTDGTVFDTTWGQDKLPTSFPIGVGSVIAGWDEGLVEQTVGSQVLLVIPPDLGYGGTDHELADQTLVFVVDILAASGGPAEG
ncbi:MAG: FKBP-type peptidyl-prolyl cis-trans isomerase [Cellulomonadaceae bacterium]|nr:FKBP-type peptidyl-prolyl cis-trans isomerase [Cellulomonadaceae bacterium]